MRSGSAVPAPTMDRIARRQRRTGAKAGPPEIVLDLSRLLSRVLHVTPTGVDRVEMAYAQRLLELVPERLRFAAIHPSGVYGRLPTKAACAFLQATAARWCEASPAERRMDRWARAITSPFVFGPLQPRPCQPERPRAYLHLSARGLEHKALIRAMLRREQAMFIPFVHDLIPLQYPEYARPHGPVLYRRKMDTVSQLAAAALVNSHATAEALRPYFEAVGRSRPIRVAGLGVDAPFSFSDQTTNPPYFVTLGTIEPRKNHLLLLTIWRRLVEAEAARPTPKLLIIGRRGWENENILDLLDRCPALRGVVEERGCLGDRDLDRILVGARAVLTPSFAEGFGLPVVEALARGVPVIASDLPALREAGGAVPDFLDPLDGPAWMRAILDYAHSAAPRRAAQLARLSRWRPPRWEDGVDVALNLIEEVCV